MEEIFSTSENVIQKKLDINQNTIHNLETNENLDYYFDIDKTVAWINENNFKRVFYLSYLFLNKNLAS